MQHLHHIININILITSLYNINMTSNINIFITVSLVFLKFRLAWCGFCKCLGALLLMPLVSLQMQICVSLLG